MNVINSYKYFLNLSFLQIFLLLQCCLVLIDGSHRSIDEAKAERQKLVQKYLKTLKKEEGAIKLVGGKTEHEGNIEILHDGKWGAICDDEWDKNEATVVCRQLGFPGVLKATHSGNFGMAKRKFWMDNLFCKGDEKELTHCRFDGWGHNDCESTEAAGVVCKSATAVATVKPTKPHQYLKKPKYQIKMKERIELRLRGGRVPTEGRVEVRFGKGSWGTICGDGWSLLEANVVCRELGMGYASDSLQTDYFGGSNVTKLFLGGTECYGNETSLADCMHQEFGHRVFCPGQYNYVAAVMCTEKMADLIFDHIELEQSLHLEDKQLFYLQCAMEENCLASAAYEIQKENPAWHLETRRLLKFTARVLNAGTADFRPHIPKHMWEWHMCHMHYHSMEVFATFDIYNQKKEKVAEGHKASFCLEDNQCLNGVEPKYFCANYGDQGISVNCSDIYRYNIDCQWVDITDLDFGVYTFKVAVNSEFKVPEITFDNNAAVCELLYTESYARVTKCRMERP